MAGQLGVLLYNVLLSDSDEGQAAAEWSDRIINHSVVMSGEAG